MYNRYAESARVNWTLHFANVLDPARGAEWRALVTPSDIGLIIRSIKTDFKFVRRPGRAMGRRGFADWGLANEMAGPSNGFA